MVQTVCMPGKFAALCKNLTEEQKLIVTKIRLGGLLSIPSMPIQRMLVESLAENFNEMNRTFNLRGHVVSMSTWDMYCVLGLFDEGDKIEISRKQADPTLFNLYKEKGVTAITFKYMEERIPKEADEVHFIRLFVLFAIGTILAPSSKEFVGSNYLHLVADVSKIKGLNWARFTLDHLSERLAMFKNNRRTGLAGNLAFLQVWYFEHFRATGDCFDYDLHEHPLIKNWHEAKVLKRARLEGIKKFGAEKVVFELDPNESKVHTVNNNFDEREYGGHKVEKDEVNDDGLHDANGDDKSKIKVTMESVKSLLENTNMAQEVHTIIQILVKLADGNNKAAKCEEKQCRSGGTSKPGEYHSVHDESDKAIPASEKGKPCPPYTDAQMDFSFRSSDRSNFSSQAKRKIDFITSPTLVEKVKLRRNRQPSKVLKSPYGAFKQRRVSSKKMSAASVDEVTEGLNLSESELAAIAYVREQIVVAPKTNILSIDGMDVNASQLDCLVRPVREDGLSKWLCTWIMSSYVSMFNSEWDKDTENKKHAIAAETCQWLQVIVAEEWRKTGLPYHRWKSVFKQLVEADMIFIPINTTNSHWWLCVLYPAARQVQVLDSYQRPGSYKQQTNDLIIGIHSILQAGMSSLDKFKSRWSNYDIKNWSVSVKKNIPRQMDACSCGIFTIKYMQHWNGSEMTNTFSQKDMETFRKKMLAELILSPLNRLTSTKDYVNAMQNS